MRVLALCAVVVACSPSGGERARGADDRDDVPAACREKLPRYFVSSVRECARANGPIRVERYHVESREEKRIEGWAEVQAGDTRIDVDFSCRRKAMVGWFPSSAGVRRVHR